MEILVGAVIVFVFGFLFGLLVMALCHVSADCDDRQGMR